MATYIKPAPRFATSDWFTSNYAVSTNAEQQRNMSSDVRQEAWFLRNETGNKTKWDQYDNNMRLSDRIDHIREWKTILEKTLAKLNKEINDLGNAKENLENSLEAKNLSTDVNDENLVAREARIDIDLVNDEVDDQLHKEQQLINAVKKQLQKKIDEAFEQLCRLQESRQQVLADLQDKTVAYGIDIDQYNLTDDSPGISYKPDPTRIIKGSTTPQQWEEFSRYNKNRADTEMESSIQLRNEIYHTLQQTDNDLAAQNMALLYALRKRIHELTMAIDELNWNKEQTENEIAELEEDIRRTMAAIRAKVNPTKLAETRLENRTYRPNVELCLDNVHYGLTDEVKQLQATRAALEGKLKQQQHALDGLEKNLHRINQDLHCKTNSLRLDEQCVLSRGKLDACTHKMDAAIKKATTTTFNRLVTGARRVKTAIIE